MEIASHQGRENQENYVFLIYNKNKYPPILVLSIANQLNDGKELLLNDFNNDVKYPFKLFLFL